MKGAFQQALKEARRLVDEDRGFAEGNRSVCLARPRPSEAACLLIHGFSASPWECLDLARHLHAKGHNVLVPRLAGHGGGREAFDRSTAADWQASVERAWGPARGLGKKFVVVGQSGGAVQAVLACDRHPGEASALVLACPAYRLANPAAPFSRFAPVRWVVPQVRFEPHQPDVKAHWQTAYSTRPVAELVRAGARAAAVARRLKVPVAQVQPSRDGLVDSRTSARVFASMGSPEKWFLQYESTEHNVLHWHNHRQAEVFTWIDAFLRRWS